MAQYEHVCTTVCRSVSSLLFEKDTFFTKNTRSTMCQTLLGVGSLLSEIDKRKLMFFHKITLLSEDSLSKQIFLRRLFLYQHRISNSNTVNQYGFIPDLDRILTKYRLKHYLDNFTAGAQLTTKTCWKQIINKSVRNHEKQRLAMLYEKDKDFVRFQRVHTSQNVYHLWKVPSSATELKLIHFIVKSLTLVPQNVQQTCSYCGQFFKDVFLHIVTSCQTTLEIRNTFLEFIVDYFTPQFSVYVTDFEH